MFNSQNIKTKFKYHLTNRILTQVNIILIQIFIVIQLLSRTIIIIEALENKLQLKDLINTNDMNSIVWDSNSLYKKQFPNKIDRFKRSLQVTTTANQLVDACQSKMEIITPYYATNSKGKVRTVVNSELMQQAIQIETCVRMPHHNYQTHNNNHNLNDIGGKCNAQIDCGCEQKYKWHRLLVLDSKDSEASKGLFMDWFLFPSSCVCRCKSSTTQIKTLIKQQHLKKN